MDAASVPLSSRGYELLNPRERLSGLSFGAEWIGVRLNCASFRSLTDVCRLVLTFVMPIGLANIGWKMYMVNGSWDIVVAGLIVRLLPFPRSHLLILEGVLLG